MRSCRCRSPAGWASASAAASSQRAALAGGGASLFLASLATGLGGLAAGLARLRRRVRRHQRRGERAGARARAAVRAADPVLVPRGVQRRRPRRAPASARSWRRPASGRARTSACSALVLVVGALAGGRRLLPPERCDTARRAPDPRPAAAGAARARRGSVLHAAGRGSRRRLERRLPLGLARRHRRRGGARLHRLLARDGREPPGRRPPERTARPRRARARRRPGGSDRPRARARRSAPPPAALLGFVAMGAGLGVVVPVLFRAAGSTPGVPAGVGDRGRLDHRLARLPRRPAGDRLRSGRGRAARRARARRRSDRDGGAPRAEREPAPPRELPRARVRAARGALGPRRRARRLGRGDRAQLAPLRGAARARRRATCWRTATAGAPST